MTNLAVVNATGGTVYVKTSGAGTSGDPHVYAETIDGTVTVDGSGFTQPVSAASLPLPTGAATAANQTSTNSKLDGLLVEMQLKANLDETQPISAASLPLPSGAATSANQSTLNTTMGSVLTELQAKADLTEVQPVGGTVSVTAGTVSLSGVPAVSQSGAWNVGGTVALSGTPAITIAEADLDWVTGTLAASGDGTVMAAPGAGSTLVINRFQLQLEGAAAQTCLTKAGTVTKYRALMQSQGDGAAWAFDVGREWEVGENLPVVLNLSGTASVGYSFYRYTRAV